jgi:uncharacterized membrane protein
MTIPSDIGGGLLVIVFFVAYLLLFILSLLVLIRLVILLPVLTKLAQVACDRLNPDFDRITNDRRLLELEDLLRLNRITHEEYTAKRAEILNDL